MKITRFATDEWSSTPAKYHALRWLYTYRSASGEIMCRIFLKEEVQKRLCARPNTVCYPTHSNARLTGPKRPTQEYANGTE